MLPQDYSYWWRDHNGKIYGELTQKSTVLPPALMCCLHTAFAVALCLSVFIRCVFRQPENKENHEKTTAYQYLTICKRAYLDSLHHYRKQHCQYSARANACRSETPVTTRYVHLKARRRRCRIKRNPSSFQCSRLSCKPILPLAKHVVARCGEKVGQPET